MWQEVLQLAVKNGLWAVLFLALLVFVLKDSKNREDKYQETIKDLTTHLGVVNDIKKEVEEVKEIVFKDKNKKRAKKGEKSNEEQA